MLDLTVSRAFFESKIRDLNKHGRTVPLTLVMGDLTVSHNDA